MIVDSTAEPMDAALQCNSACEISFDQTPYSEKPSGPQKHETNSVRAATFPQDSQNSFLIGEHCFSILFRKNLTSPTSLNREPDHWVPGGTCDA